jgi:dienelactone hydrolase
MGILLTLGPTHTPCYYTAPSSDTRHGIVVYTDVWGFQSRIRQICDYLARHGNFHVTSPDCFRGETYADHRQDLAKWLSNTPYEPSVAQDTQACLEYLKSKGVHGVGTMGFCWGAWAIGKSSQAGIPWRAAVAMHPSFKVERVAFDGDDVQVMKQIACPLLMLAAGNDLDYTKPGSPEEQDILERGGKCVLFPDMVHGWMTRGDMKDANIDRDVKIALQETLGFLRSKLGENEGQEA